ncbi:probable 28S ribosomal protein S23, mitochondrial [Pecten maximus]|uniref:probable 28S ribosomal protein S23, mitochondrial n=1 Tax=Pecten maximus TaxID=6579 RepID=UPI0014581260|nr:probable 28S ribosomal protein S23, mitochondrial [Pecten maximus]
MAASKTEKIRSIFQRCQRLIRAGGLPESEKPLWYDVYAAFPPAVEPLYNRPVPTKRIRSILYPEDLVRARYYKEIYDTDLVDMKNEQKPTTSQRFVDKYFELRKTDCNNPDLFAATVDALRDDGLKLTTWKERESFSQSHSVEEYVSRKPFYTAEEVFGEFTIDRQAKNADSRADDMDIDNLAADLFD